MYPTMPAFPVRCCLPSYCWCQQTPAQIEGLIKSMFFVLALPVQVAQVGALWRAFIARMS